jgi:hypothetical protein
MFAGTMIGVAAGRGASAFGAAVGAALTTGGGTAGGGSGAGGSGAGAPPQANIPNATSDKIHDRRSDMAERLAHRAARRTPSSTDRERGSVSWLDYPRAMNDVSSAFLAVLGAMLTRLPVWALWLVTIVLALVRKDLPRKAANLAAFGGIVLFVSNILFGTLQSLMPMWRIKSGNSITEMAQVSTLLSILSNIVTALGAGLLVAAIFVERTPDPNRPR